jgi:hypothetical protein
MIRLWFLLLALGCASASRASEANEPWYGVPEREPRITAEAAEAAQQHHRRPSPKQVDERYRIFMAGINREWLNAAAQLVTELDLEPDAEQCGSAKERLEEAATKQPFSIYIAWLQQHCAAMLEPRRVKQLERRVEANFLRMAKLGGESRFNAIPIFLEYDALVYTQLLGYRWQHALFQSDNLHELNLIAYAHDGDRKKPTYRRFVFNLIGEDLVAKLDSERFSNTLGLYYLWTGVLGEMRSRASAEVLYSSATSESAEAIDKALAEREPSVEVAFAMLERCASGESKKCRDSTLIPLTQAAEEGDVMALMALASERLLGLTSEPNVGEGMLLWDAAERRAGFLATDFLLPSLPANFRGSEVRDRLLEAARKGDPASRLKVIEVVPMITSEPKKRAFVRALGDLARVPNNAEDSAELRFANHGVREALLGPVASEASCGWAHVAFPSTLERCWQAREQSRGNVFAPMRAIAAAMNAKKDLRTRARRELAGELANYGSMQEAVDAWFSLAGLDDALGDGIEAMLLSGHRPALTNRAGLMAQFDKDLQEIVGLQWDVAAGSTNLEALAERCHDDVNACHAVMPLLFELPPAERNRVLAKTSEDDPPGKRSLGAELNARMLMRSGQDTLVDEGLKAFERLAKPHHAATSDYLSLRCGSGKHQNASAGYRFIPTLVSKTGNLAYRETVAQCLAANGMLPTAALQFGEIIKRLEQLNDPGGRVAEMQARLKAWQKGEALLPSAAFSPQVPMLHLAAWTNRWSSGFGRPKEIDVATPLVRKFRLSFIRKDKRGVDAVIERAQTPPLEANRSKLQIIGDGKRVCRKQDGELWLCAEVDLARDILHMDFRNRSILHSEVVQADESTWSCANCSLLVVHSIPDDRFEGSMLFLERGLRKQTFLFKPLTKKLIAYHRSEAGHSFQYRFDYDQNELPSRCKDVALSTALELTQDALFELMKPTRAQVAASKQAGSGDLKYQTYPTPQLCAR